MVKFNYILIYFLGETPLILSSMRGWNNFYKRVKDFNTKSKRCKIVEMLLENGSSL